ncbi:Phosphoglucomutase @ Phosphomannomutase [hydrothermal vent metagenome]|uniref:Phosphoglucomutase @ Phosphomannomutase n=1 Tax=hydrothermal vent metagenome TaxID=652676 RepID=A0A3B1BGC7_9ZZZZ
MKLPKLPFGKKKNDSTPAAPAKKRSTSHAPGAGSFLLVSFIAVTLIVYGSAAVLFVAQLQQNEQTAVRHLKMGAEALAARLSDRMNYLSTMLDQAADDAELAKLLLSGDSDDLRGKEKAIRKLVPGVWHVRLFPFEWNELDTQRKPHMSFASLDILRQAEQGKTVTAAEMHQFGSEHQHIALAAPVFSPGEEKEVAGVVHASFRLSQMQAAIDAVSDYGGRVEVRQVGGSKALTLAVNKGAEGTAGKVAAGITVAGTIWEIVYLEPSVMPDQTALLKFLGVPTLGLVLIGLVMFVQSKRLTQALKKDQGSIISMVEAAIKGEAVVSPAANTADCEVTFALIAQLGTNYARRRKSAGSAAAPVQEAASDSLLMLDPTSPDDLAMDTASSLNSLEAALAGSGEGTALPDSIFLAYDIRGIAGETLTKEMVYELGRAIGSEAYDQGQQTVIVGRDGRTSSDILAAALSQGLQDSGRDVLDIGMVPVPVLYFATHFLGSNAGVMLTASHNPAEYNGLKIVLNGESVSAEVMNKLRLRVEVGDLLQGDGARQEQNLIPDYISRITGDVKPARPLKVVIDCGNAVAGVVAPQLLKELGCEVVELFCKVDGNFPNHHPDPSKPENMQALVQQVVKSKADLGVAFDGDGDRLGVVDSAGKIIWPDRLLMLFAADVLSRQPGGDIIFDVKSTRSLAGHIVSHGGRPTMWKAGHSLMKSKLKETGALLAGEMSGHIFFKERWFGFDDALYACARLLEILSADPRSTEDVFAELPESVSTPELLMDMPDGKHHELVEKAGNMAQFENVVKIITIDGVRAEFENGWGLIRPSNTISAVTFRFEATNAKVLNEIQNKFRQLLMKIDPGLKLPF